MDASTLSYPTPTHTPATLSDSRGSTPTDRANPASDPAAQPVQKAARVLLVEDNLVNQKVACLVLKRMGCTYAVANNGLEALNMLESDRYDIVLMDCQMPVMDGYTATRQIREREAVTGKHIPIVAVTAHAMAGDREKCLESGMDDYSTKPINLATVEKIIAQYVPHTAVKA